jgi:hypothetical protein
MSNTQTRTPANELAAMDSSAGDERESTLQQVSVTAAKEGMMREIASWAGITVHEHRFGGVEFRKGNRELGHLHSAFADLPFPRPLRDELIAAGRAKPHHILPDSGWVTVPMRTCAEVANVTELFRRNYERAVGTAPHIHSGAEVPFFY